MNQTYKARQVRQEVVESLWRRVAARNGYSLTWGDWVIVRTKKDGVIRGKIKALADSGTGNAYPLCSSGSFEVSRLREEIGDAMKAEQLVTMA